MSDDEEFNIEDLEFGNEADDGEEELGKVKGGEEEQSADTGGLELDGLDDLDDGLDLGDTDDGGLDLSASDDGGLELGDADDGGLELGDSDEDGLELGDADDGGLELGDSDDGGLELGDSDDIGLELGDSGVGVLDLSASDDGGLELGDTDDSSSVGDLVLGQEETSLEIKEEIDELSFVADDAAKEAIPEMPTMAEIPIPSPIGDDKGENTLVYESKLAEIDAMMGDEDSDLASESQSDKTADIEIPKELSANAQTDSQANFSKDQLDSMIQSQDEALPEMPEIKEMPIPMAKPVEAENHNTHVRHQLAEINEMMDDGEEVVAAEGVVEVPKANPVPVSSQEITEQKIIMEHHSDELLRLQGIINELRDDRSQLLDKIDGFEDKINKTKQNNLSEKAELEEKRIELSLVKRNLNRRLEDYQSRLEISEEKKEILLEKNKQINGHLEGLKSELHQGIQKIGTREKDLENKLELLRSDAEVQISNRDAKILELKRKVDTLDFSIKHVSSNEQKSKMLKIENEEKMNKVMNTLRNAISIIEDDGNIEHKLQVIKKSIDV